MVEIPLSPTACALVTTLILFVTFYLGRWCGISWCADELMKMMLLKPGRQVTVSKLAGTWELSNATLPLTPA
jgi:hypothetical protein